MQSSLALSSAVSSSRIRASFVFAVLLTAVIGFPIIRVAGVPIPTILLASALVLFASPIRIGPRVVWVLSLTASAALLGIGLLNSRYNSSYGLKDLLYFLVPIQFFCGFVLFNSIFGSKPDLLKTAGKFLAVFLIVQLAAVGIELLRVGPLIALMTPYLHWFLMNTSSTAEQLSYITLRPSGLVGNPVILGVLSYILGRLLSYYYKKPVFLVLGLLLVLVSAARMAMVGIIVAELVAFFVSPRLPVRLTKRSLVFIVLGVLAVIAGLVVMAVAIPFMRDYIAILMSGDFAKLSGDYSVAYRSQMYTWAMQHPDYLLFGGLSLADAPAYVDSELLMRSLQLGIIGFLCLQVPVITILICGIKKKSRELAKFGVGLYVFALVCSFTFAPFSDPYFVIWYSLIAAFCWAGFKGRSLEEHQKDSYEPA